MLQVWIVDNSGSVEHQSPLGTVSSLWPGMPRTPDAGFTWTNGLTYFFIGTTKIKRVCQARRVYEYIIEDR